jgi:Bacterial Ig-like domain
VDKDAPVLMAVSPDTGSLNVRTRSVLLRFDEVVNERSTPIIASAGAGRTAPGGSGSFGGGQMGSSLGSLVLVSPGDGRERVTWRRTAIEIEPRGGFRPNTTYRVTLLPGLADLRGNVLKEAVEVVFSTGSTRTTGEVAGVIFDWVAGKHIPNARVEVFLPADSTRRWSARADSLGGFAVRDLGPGTYRLRGWTDTDNDRTIDERELFDSLTIQVDSTLRTELYAFVHDTIGPRIETLELVDSTALRLKFDRGVAVDWAPDSATAAIMRADSSFVPVGRMLPAALFDSLRTAAAARDDSVSAAADSVAQRDTTAARDTAAAAPRAPVAPARRAPVIVREGAAGPGADTTRIPPPKLSRPVPVLNWVVEFSAPLAPGEYRVLVTGVRGLGGSVRPSERAFRIRPPAAPKDSTETAPSDRPPTAAAPAAPARPRPRP